MAFEIIETGGSEDGIDAKGRKSTGTREWTLRGGGPDPDNILTARTELLAAATDQQGNPVNVTSVWDGLVYDSLTRERLAPKLFRFVASYKEADKADKEHKLDNVGDYEITFDTTGGAVRIRSTASNKVTAYALAGETAPDYKGAINVPMGGGEPEGVEIPVAGSFRISIRYKHAQAAITSALIRTWASLKGSTNDDTFYGFNAGELLYLGATGRQSNRTDPEVTHTFSGSVNATGLQVGDITGIDKKGHEYLWVQFRREEDAAAVPKLTITKAFAAYVHEVSPQVDFSTIGIGTG